MPDRAVVDEYMCPECGYRVDSDLPEPLYCCICAGDKGEDVRLFRVTTAAEPQPRALVALSEDRRSLVFLVPSKDGEAQWWSICHWDREADRMEPMYRIVDKGQDAHDVLSWYEGELSETRAILRDGLRAVLAEGGRNGA